MCARRVSIRRIFVTHQEKLEEIHTLLEQELHLYQRWLSLLTQVEDSISYKAQEEALLASTGIQEIVQEVATIRFDVIDAISDFSRRAAQNELDSSVVLAVFTLQENITLLQNKVNKKAITLQKQVQVAPEGGFTKQVQLSVDHSLDVLQQLSQRKQ